MEEIYKNSGIKKHDTIAKTEYKYRIDIPIEVINTTKYDIRADIFFDIDTYKITIFDPESKPPHTLMDNKLIFSEKEKKCPKCNGRGRITPSIPSGLVPDVNNCDFSEKCPECNGTGKIKE